MATLSQMMNPQMMQALQMAQRGAPMRGISPERTGTGGGMPAPMTNPAGMQQMRPGMQQGVPQGGGMQRGNPQAWAAGMQQAMQRGGMSPQAQQLQQMAQRFGQPATTPQFDPRAYMAQQQAAQQQRWQQMMQQLQANPPAPGMTPQSWTTPRTWGNTNAGVTGTQAAANPSAPASPDPNQLAYLWSGYQG